MRVLTGLPSQKPGAVLHVDAVGRGVLAHHQQFLDARLEQPLGLAQHVADRPRHQVAAHARDDAERAAMVAALADLQVRVVARRQLDALRRHQVDERIVRLGHVQVDGVHHLLRGVRAGDGQHLRMDLADQVVAARLARLRAQAAGDDHLAVLGQRLADRVQAFLDRVVDEPAGVDHHQVGARVALARAVALGAQLREDELGVGQGLGAAQGNKGDDCSI
jgi:hypothetical protein